MMDPIFKLQPHRTMHLQGFDDYGAAAALWGASDTGFTVSGVFRDMADFAVLVLFQKDDPFGHPRFSYLPDGDLTGLVLDFDVTWSGIQSWESLKSAWTDWNALDYSVNGVGSNAKRWFGTPGITVTPNTTGRTGASATYALNLASPQPGDKVTLWYQNLSFVSPAISASHTTTDQAMWWQGNAAYNHWVTIGSATYSCLEDSLNSAGVANNIAGQINASDPNCSGHHWRRLWQRDLHHAEGRSGRTGRGFEFRWIGRGHAHADNRCIHPAVHCAADQRCQLGAERPRRAQRRRGRAEPVGDHGGAGRRWQHGGVLSDGQQQRQPSILHRNQLELVRRLFGQRVLARSHRLLHPRLEQRGQGLVDHRARAPQRPRIPADRMANGGDELDSDRLGEQTPAQGGRAWICSYRGRQSVGGAFGLLGRSVRCGSRGVRFLEPGAGDSVGIQFRRGAQADHRDALPEHARHLRGDAPGHQLRHRERVARWRDSGDARLLLSGGLDGAVAATAVYWSARGAAQRGNRTHEREELREFRLVLLL